VPDTSIPISALSYWTRQGDEGESLSDDRNFEWAVATGERAFTYLKQLQTPPVPRNYELFFTYAAGYDKELNDAIRDAVFAHASLPEEEVVQTGDQVLRVVAQTLKTNIKGGDHLSRYGGEEFALLLPRTALADAVKLADKLIGSIKARELVQASSETEFSQLTLSVGIAVYQPGESLQSFVQLPTAAFTPPNRPAATGSRPTRRVPPTAPGIRPRLRLIL
jgi:Diguanylate cyclase, GGDEF domain